MGKDSKPRGMEMCCPGDLGWTSGDLWVVEHYVEVTYGGLGWRWAKGGARV